MVFGAPRVQRSGHCLSSRGDATVQSLGTSLEVWEWSSSVSGLDLSQVRDTSLSLSGRDHLGKVDVGKVSTTRHHFAGI
jgi:hypothetical protein